MQFVTPKTFTSLLAEARLGKAEAREELIQLVYQDLRRLAQNYLNHEAACPSLQATALVHEVYLRLFGDTPIHFADRQHFLIIAARQMRRILIDHARSNRALKRNSNGGSLSLDDTSILQIPQNIDAYDLDTVLSDLERLYPRAGQVIELRFFAGLTEAETARVLGVSETTVKREWKFARAWLYGQLIPQEALTSDGH